MSTLVERPAEPETSGKYRWARERAEMLQGLYIHLVVFITVNAGLVAINWLTRGEDGGWWFWLPMLIWGFGLVVHASTIYLPVFSQKWVDQKTDDLIGRG